MTIEQKYTQTHQSLAIRPPPRPHLVSADEFGPMTGELKPEVPVDFAVQSLNELADIYRI